MDTTNEPVAWLIQTKTAHQFTFKEPTIIPLDAAVIPLYTHPAKTLTDEEIIEIGNAVTNLIDSNEGWIEFARTILRKAQEK